MPYGRQLDNVVIYQNDHLGTPQKMTAVNGAVVWSAKYNSFGQAIVEVETIENNLRFAGQYFDAETGLHYNYHRYYNPDTGRYMSVDPIGSDSGDNLYSYANNMPVQYGDVRGMYCERISPWKRVTAIENDTDKAKLLSRTVKGKWNKINEWVVLVIPGRNMPRGGGTGKIGYACQWEKVGCLQTSLWQKPVLHEAKFRCGIGECPKKEWEETRRKELDTQFTVVKDLSWRRCLYSFRKKTTYSWIKGGCKEPSS